MAVAVIVINVTDLPETSKEEKPFSYGFLVLGAATILVCLVGFVGALKGHICTTWVYAISQLVLLIAMIALMTVSKMHHEKKTPPEEILKVAFEQQKNGKDAMVEYQEKYQCCGINGYVDYIGMVLPKSCRGENNEDHPGCLRKMKSEEEDDLEAPQFIGWALMVVQMASFVCSTILGVKLNNKARRAQY
ncbi:hypothetical protein KR026_002632 [Drosophila bipectinata]|nr:hypothetical protein KR026_002632 [Drosophila bipectinata]